MFPLATRTPPRLAPILRHTSSSFLHTPPSPPITLWTKMTASRKRDVVTQVSASTPSSPLTPDPSITNPDFNSEVVDGLTALRASPDEERDVGQAKRPKRATRRKDPPTEEEDGSGNVSPMKKPKRAPTRASVAAKKGADEIKAFIAAKQLAEQSSAVKMEVDGEEEQEGGGGEKEEDIEIVKLEAKRPPPVNADQLPLPWKGRLGYACLNTYLRYSNPPVFSSRTCRIASILEHRHPLAQPDEPEHATKNRPDKTAPASIERGQRFVEELGLANARDIIKMVRWNDKYGIKFLRLSSEMFPFASHEEYGYRLAPFASDVLAEAGRVAGELGHRLTTHPGQFTQLGSPRQAVIENAIRDLEYHAELLSLLKLPPQGDRDAVMILHLGGVFGDKEATVQRFRENYQRLSDEVKARLVLENDDVSWSVHDLLPICEELNIPLVLDYHHHNIIFDADKLREGTRDIIALYPRIKATWDRKGITQKMHYSEPTPEAITGRQRRKHNARPATLPPCATDMDLMIEAKDKEQAVFELMRTFKLPSWDTFNNVVPYEREDDNRPHVKPGGKKQKTKKQIKAEEEDPSLVVKLEEDARPVVPPEELGMGGPQNRVYWPPGMEEWLRPKKREVKKKSVEELDADALARPTPMNLKQRKEAKARLLAKTKEMSEEESSMPSLPSLSEDEPVAVTRNGRMRSSTRQAKAKVSYAEESEE